ncbi:MAG: T9SS type A sorting domain-containing protein, partial [Bacteroidota bacterium]
GVRVFDVTDPVEAEEIAFFDTFPANDNSGFNGTWSNYPFFPSRNVIVTGRGAGLFVIRPTELVFGVSTETPTPAAVSLSAPYPNPTAGMTRASFTLNAPASVRAIVYDVLGREVYQVLNAERPAGIVELEIDTAPLPSGVYFLRVTTSETSVTRAFVRR